jgi:hypothetical protein
MQSSGGQQPTVKPQRRKNEIKSDLYKKARGAKRRHTKTEIEKEQR